MSTTPHGDSQVSAIRHGSKVGRFVIVAELGSGGMGVVYAAHDRELDRQVALKVMRGTGEDEYEDRMRMLREGQAMARVTHPNVITVFEVGTEGGTVFLAQELLDGGTLGQWLETPHTQDEIIEKFVAAGRGLAAAHAAGLVHRDFKPDNVLLGKDGRVRVSDFGLARALGMSSPDALAGPTNRGGGPPRPDVDVTKSPMSQLTRTGAVMGTPMFMAPEQHEGRRADERSDQFAFSVALYHALYGEFPFDGKTAVALADNVINGVMKEPPANKKVPPRIRKILLRGLSIDPAARYPSMDAMLAELTARPASNKVPLIIGGVAIAIGAAVTAYMLLVAKPDDAAKVVEQPKSTPIVIKQGDLTIDHDETLAKAIDRGFLDDVTKPYASEAMLLKDQHATRAATAEAALAFTLALGGDLPGADERVKQAEASKGQDPRAIAFVDLAKAAINAARGDLPTALDQSHRCAAAFEKDAPVMAAMCFQIKADVAADMGKVTDAKEALRQGLAAAEAGKSEQLKSMLELAEVQLDFDDKQHDVSDAKVVELQKDARERGAISCEASASVLASRIRSMKSEQETALEDLTRLKLDRLQVYRLRMMAKIAIGELYGYRNEGDQQGTGLEQLDKVIEEASKKDFWGVYLEAKLARVRVLLTTGAEDAELARKELIREANSRGYIRIARLAEKYDVASEKPVDKPTAPPSETPAPP